jgi:hypothetical protein
MSTSLDSVATALVRNYSFVEGLDAQQTLDSLVIANHATRSVPDLAKSVKNSLPCKNLDCASDVHCNAVTARSLFKRELCVHLVTKRPKVVIFAQAARLATPTRKFVQLVITLKKVMKFVSIVSTTILDTQTVFVRAVSRKSCTSV